MKQKSGWLCGVVCCVLSACALENTEGVGGNGGNGGGGSGGSGVSGKHSTVEEGQLLVVEIMADPHGVDTEKEYIEIHNPTDAALSLEGLEVFVIPQTTGKEKSFALPAREVPPGAYITLGDVAPSNRPAHIDIGYERALGALPNTQATVGLRKIGGALIDSTHYSSTKVGRALSRHCPHGDSQLCPNAEASWCFAETDTLYDGQNHGSPGRPNAACKKTSTVDDNTGDDDTGDTGDDDTVDTGDDDTGDTGDDDTGDDSLPPGSCFENGVARAIRVPQAGALLLNELMVDPHNGLNDSEAEWVELLAVEAVDLNGLELRTRSRSQKISSDACLPVEAGAYVLLASSFNPELNGCLEEVDVLLNVSLPNDSPASNRQSLSLYVGEDMVDSVTYPTVQQARSYQRDVETLEWCYLPANATTVYDTCREESGNRGTPKAENIACP